MKRAGPRPLTAQTAEQATSLSLFPSNPEKTNNKLKHKTGMLGKLEFRVTNDN